MPKFIWLANAVPRDLIKPGEIIRINFYTIDMHKKSVYPLASMKRFEESSLGTLLSITTILNKGNKQLVYPGLKRVKTSQLHDKTTVVRK